jgi:hypothetical protein
VISAFIGVLFAGTVRPGRWTFWLAIVPFLSGVLRVPASILEVAGVVTATGPNWYLLFQAALGPRQFGISLAMLSTGRRAGVWAAVQRLCIARLRDQLVLHGHGNGFSATVHAKLGQNTAHVEIYG